MNIYDIAKKAGVSPSTVSRVLNNNSIVKAQTREKILEIIKENNYVPSSVARSLSVKETSNIGVIVPDILNSFFSSIMAGVNEKAEEYDYNTVLFGTKENVKRQHEVLQIVKQENLKGLIIVPVIENDKETIEVLIQMEKEGVPVVLIDRDINNASFDGVFSDDRRGTKNAVEILIKEGHKKIAIINGPLECTPGRHRFMGYKEALSEHNIHIDEKYVKSGNFMLRPAYNATKELMELDEPPTAIFSSNNRTTLGCLQYFYENNIKIGEDIGFIGFDDIEALRYSGMHMSVVDRDVFAMGVEAMKLLQMRFEENTDTRLRRRIIVDSRFISRGSEKLKG